MILLAAALVYFGGVALLGAIPVNADFVPPSSGVEVCVRTNGIHADLVVPAVNEVADWRAAHPPEHFAAPPGEPPWIAFGWGDRAFYLETPNWSDLRLGTALAAVSGLGEAAMHVEYLDAPGGGERVACTRLAPEQYRLLARHIEGSFRRDAQGALERIAAPGYGSADAFYEARGAYSLVRTCNEWVREGLSASGVRAPAWSPFDGALLRQLRAAQAGRD